MTATESSKVTQVNGGSKDPSGNGFDVDSNGMIVAVGPNVVVWVSAGDVGKYVSSDIPAENIHVYDQGNAQGNEGKTDIFVLHEDSTYTQGDGTQHSMNAVNGNREPASSNANDYIFVPGSSSWSSSAGSANVNNSINYYESVNVTINGKTYGGNNRVSEVISGDGKEGLDPSHPDTHTTWQYELNIDANLDGAAGNDHISSIKLTGLPPGTTISYNGEDYTVDANGNVVIDITGDSNLDIDLTFTSSTQIDDLGSIKVEITTEVDGSSHSSGDIDANSGDHAITLTGDEDHHTESDSANLMTADDDVHHATADHVDTTDTADSSQDNVSDNHTDTTGSVDNTDNSTSIVQPEETGSVEQPNEESAADQIEEDSASDHSGDANSTASADGTDTADDNAATDQDTSTLLVDHDDLDLSNVDQDTSLTQPAEENPETSLTLLLDDIDSQLNGADTAQSVETPADNAAATDNGGPNQANVIDLSDIIHDDDAKDLSSLIQVADSAGNDPAAGHVQDVPAESSGGDSGEHWGAHEAAELDSLIAQPDTDA
ncbi:TPA: hypothetical protein R4S64_005214 [Kluyvera georgiana]|nr:hypothetical protein [Kluyvera georgiana]